MLGQSTSRVRLLGLPLLVLFLLPVFGLVFAVDITDLVKGLMHPAFLSALGLSIRTTFISMVFILLFGTPLAWWMAKSSGQLRTLFETITDLPIVVPPAVVGLGLLFVFSSKGLLGGTLSFFGVQIAFSTVAVVLAQTVIAGPFYVHAAHTAFRQVPEDLLLVARTLGKTPTQTFWRVRLPIARPGLLSGATLAAARALGEFGATLLFAGSQVGVTQTMPVAIYMTMESDIRVSVALALVLVFCALLLISAVRLSPWLLNRRRLGQRNHEGGDT